MSLLDRVGRFIDDVLLLPDDVRQRLEDAEVSLDNGALGEAEERFLGVLADRPSLARAWAGLAQTRERQRDLAGAREALEQACDLAPEEGDLALWAARLALEAGDADAAARAARDAAGRVAGEGMLAEASALRGRAEWQRGRPDRAVRELRKAVSAAPDERSLRVELIEALVDAGRDPRPVAAALDPEDTDPAVAMRVGRALESGGVRSAARPWLEQASAAGEPAAAESLARDALREGRLDAAEQRAREAVAGGAGGSALGVLGEILLARGRAGDAADALMEAAAQARDVGEQVSLLQAAGRAVPLDDTERLRSCADALGRVAPKGEPVSDALRAWIRLADEPASAPEMAPAAEGHGVTEPRGVLARTRILLLAGRPRDALETLDRYDALVGPELEPSADRAVASAIRRDALRAQWRGAAGEVDLAAAIDAVARFADERALGEVERRTAALRDELDRPLKLAILGEFNAGKSTLVNAFVGADVAPTGIVPTTATLNVLRAGAERRARVVRRDGTTREGEWSALRSLLEAEEPASVDHVEITVPSDRLERVHILDTPGTNAPVADHETLAREAWQRADVVLWIFDAVQAGKETEGHTLREMVAAGREVLAVLNKRDRLEPGGMDSVRQRLASDLPEIAEASRHAVAISARQALQARTEDVSSADGSDDGGFADLLADLEDRVFARSRELKRRACALRLRELLRDALETERHADAARQRQVETLRALTEPLTRVRDRLQEAVDATVRELDAAQTRAFHEAAEEVLAFVRPRRTRFSRHGADPEDRSFLAELLERRLAEVGDAHEEALARRMSEHLREALGDGGVASLVGAAEGASADAAADLLDEQVRGAVAPAFAAFAGVQRGLLQGGALGRFFEQVLPRANLAVEPIAEALGAARADPRDELRPALGDAVEAQLLRRLERRRAAAASRAAVERARASARVRGPLEALEEVLGELA